MVEINLLHYRPGESLLHRLDPRGKLILIFAYLSAIINFPFQHLPVTLPLLFFASRKAGLRPNQYGRELRVFGLLGVVMFIFRSLSRMQLGTAAALIAGSSGALSFLTIVWVGILFTAVTDPSELQEALRRLLKPLPGVPEGRLSSRLSFTLLMIPLILDSLNEIIEARKCRGVELQKSLKLRLSSLLAPLFQQFISHMEEFSLALEARCFREDASRGTLRFDLAELRTTLLLLLPVLLIYVSSSYRYILEFLEGL